MCCFRTGFEESEEHAREYLNCAKLLRDARERRITYNKEKGGLFGSPHKISKYRSAMAGSSRTTFAKRQKERQRQEKQAEKAQRRLQRKAQDQETDPNNPEKPKDLTVTYNEEGIPEGFGFHDF